MGRLNYFFLFTILFLFFSEPFYGQYVVNGSVKTESNNALENASIIIEKKKDSTHIGYSFTNELGEFKKNLELEDDEVYIISAQFLGFLKSSISFTPKDLTQKTFNFILYPDTTSLSEVIITSERPIVIKKDTIIFNAKSFSDGTEAVVEDLLRKIPGLNIDDNGTIKIGNQEVEKVMVEGDDFFEKGYKTLTKNLPVAPIEKVELLQRYSNNKLLKGIEESNKVALNLTLNEDAKRQWFGNFDVGYDITLNQRYEVRSNLLNFGKKNKYYFFTNLNNIGYDATGDINSLIISNSDAEPGNIGNNVSTNPLVNLSSSLPNFKRNRYNFNNAELLSLNAIFNPSEKFKIKTIGFLNWDERDFFRNSQNNFISNGTNFTNIEEYKLTNDLFTVFGKIDTSYDINKTQTLENSTRYSNVNTRDRTDRNFNTIANIENLSSKKPRFDHQLTYSNKLTENTALLITGRYINEEHSQEYAINQFLFEDLFPESSTTNSVFQQSTHQINYLGLESHLLKRRKSGHLFEAKIGNSYHQDRVKSILNLLDQTDIISNPNGFQNDTRYTVNDTYLNLKYIYKYNSALSFIGILDSRLINNNLKTTNNIDSQTIFFTNPTIGVRFKINDTNKIVGSYSLSKTNTDIINVYDNFILNNFRSFSKGTGTFNQLNASSAVLNYSLGNWSDNFFGNILATYTKNFDFFSTNSIVNQNFILSEKTLFKDREIINISADANRYLKFIRSNLKLRSSYTRTNYKNIVNNSSEREIISRNYSAGFEIRSGFSSFFNYHLGSRWIINEIETSINNSFTDTISFLDLSFIFSQKFNIQLQTERYFFGNLERDQTYYFADLESSYSFKENKITLSISGKNLFNTTVFRNFSLNDLGNSTTEYRLLPRYILIKAKIRF